MSDSFQYKYRPLRQPDAIRLCRILPHSDAASSIHISLSSYHLSNPTLNFTALSYTWGDPSDKTPISVGGSEAFLQVPRSASEALTVLRLHGKKTLFWIDAICIDQNNLQEKTSQVRIMGRIFARAFCTTIYLGPHTKSSQIVFQDVIEAMNLPKVKNPKRQRMVRDRDPPNAAVVQGLEDLIQRPWFQRVWVLQEVYLSQNIWVLCGDTMVPQEMLRDCFFGYSKNNLVTKQNVPFAFRINEPIWGISSRLSWSDLWGCLYWTRGSLATDSRDRLFALRALFAPLEANDTDSFMAEFDKMINYEKSLEEVFETLALTLLRFIGLWLLVGARHEHNRQMPSWVPDWSQNLPLAGDFFVDLGQNELFGRQVNRATYIDYQLLDQRILIVQGWRCGQIQEMGKTYIFADLEDADRQISHLISLITIDQSSETIQRETSNIAEVGLSQGILKGLVPASQQTCPTIILRPYSSVATDGNNPVIDAVNSEFQIIGGAQ
ncbi:hypothetical protein PFICI_00403 [Pestalotiopsis fici W106-1]|uniref:Heterokaryon incompatibility domain-containing protein n=1 Tax=Pestalotiopsis fici (strain W106-1 / CGMCC3.15140) TaxID=1229662 RepID=W3XKP8_PESFW|nr:uncharacterized protein PFICI_00403 [Pestalotiopsis fici W106-1]ETS86575.1 hypothetical protein PFICI_00403 [Pestalotiopsis fici W106-1]